MSIAEQIATFRPFIEHRVIEMFGADSKYVDSPDNLNTAVNTVADRFGLKIFGRLHKHFDPQGVTDIYGLENSGLLIHDWPDMTPAYTHMDLALCDPQLNLEDLDVFLLQLFQPNVMVQSEISYRDLHPEFKRTRAYFKVGQGNENPPIGLYYVFDRKLQIPTDVKSSILGLETIEYKRSDYYIHKRPHEE